MRDQANNRSDHLRICSCWLLWRGLFSGFSLQ